MMFNTQAKSVSQHDSFMLCEGTKNIFFLLNDWIRHNVKYPNRREVFIHIETDSVILIHS